MDSKLFTIGSTIITPFGKRRYINADYTASGGVSPPIEKFINEKVLPFYSNTHSNAHNGQLMSSYISQVKESIRKSVSAKPCDKIILTGNGCTGAIVHLIHILNLRTETKPRTTVFISVAEHHSNYLPWTHLPVDLVIVPVKEDGLIDSSFYLEKIKVLKREGRPFIASFIAGSNITGIYQPVLALAKLTHRYGGLIFYDYAAIAPYVQINMHSDEESYFDAIFISPHKFLGGPGTPGLLIANNKLFRNEIPFCPGGGTVRFVCTKFHNKKFFNHYADDPEKRETGGTPNIIGSIRAGLVFQLKDKLIKYIKRREAEINHIVRPVLRNIRGLHLINPPGVDDRGQYPVYSFIVDGLHYNFVVSLLNDLFGIQSRGGVSCCSLYAQQLLKITEGEKAYIYRQIVDGHGVPTEYGWCRVTFHYTMDDETVEYILDSIKYVVSEGAHYLDQYSYCESSNNWTHNRQSGEFPKLKLKI
jgi:selenocysteine lyase/cysteine desulfurase